MSWGGLGLMTIGVFLAAVLATRAVTALLRHRAILDHPGERSSHAVPTPRGGGLALTPMILLAWAALAWGGIAGPASPALATVLVGAVVLGAVSWLDDMSGLPPGTRLAVQAVTAAGALAVMPFDGGPLGHWLPAGLAYPVAWLAWLWFINLFNFMDGIDGLAGTETISVCLGVAGVASLAGGALAGLVPLAVACAAAAAGFLVWNWQPARVFLGDVGSVPLGLILGWLLMMLFAHGAEAAAVILPLYYLADATITLGRRALRRARLFQAHREHFYQRAVQGGASHAGTVRAVAMANAALVVLALVSLDRPLAALAGGAVVVAGVLWWMAATARHKAEAAP